MNRKKLDVHIRKEKERQIAASAISIIQPNMTIGCYVSYNNEVNTTAILSYCLKNHIRICVPKVILETLQFYEIHDMNELEKGMYGILEPTTNLQVQCDNIDIMFVPIVAYDAFGHRCGYGKGYYDRILHACKYKIGLAYKEQKVDVIEVEKHDITLDDIIEA